MFAHETFAFGQAVTNPFSDAAIGAIMPDTWNPPTVPCMDRVTITLNPTAMKELGNGEAGLEVFGLCAFIVPRSLGVGWLAQATDANGNKTGYRVTNLIQITSDYGTIKDGVNPPLAEMYSLFVSVIGTTSNGQHPNLTPTLLCYSPTANNQDCWVPGYNVMSYSRSSIIAGSCTGARIVGAGIKALADDAPLQTGGSIYGGWMPLQDLFMSALNNSLFLDPSVDCDGDAVMRGNTSDLQILHNPRNTYTGCPIPLTKAATPSQRNHLRSNLRHTGFGGINQPYYVTGANLKDSLKFRVELKGLDGVTARYSPLQSAIQEEFQPLVEYAMFANDVPNSSPSLIDTPMPNLNIGIGVHDVISSSDYVPGFVWKFNTTDIGVQSYAIRLESRVHLQAQPNGHCPFMTAAVMPDPNYSRLALVLEDVDSYPVATKGASFGSFFSGLGRSLGRMAQRGGQAIMKDIRNPNWWITTALPILLGS
jgi:hypothetical protein